MNLTALIKLHCIITPSFSKRLITDCWTDFIYSYPQLSSAVVYSVFLISSPFFQKCQSIMHWEPDWFLNYYKQTLLGKEWHTTNIWQVNCNRMQMWIPVQFHRLLYAHYWFSFVILVSRGTYCNCIKNRFKTAFNVFIAVSQYASAAGKCLHNIIKRCFTGHVCGIPSFK